MENKDQTSHESLCGACKAAEDAGVHDNTYPLDTAPTYPGDEEEHQQDHKEGSIDRLSPDLESEEDLIAEDIWGSSTDDEIYDEKQPSALGPNETEHTRTRRSYYNDRHKIKMPTGKYFFMPVPKPKLRRDWKCMNSKTYIRQLTKKNKAYRIIVTEMHKTKVYHPNFHFKGYNVIKIEQLVNGCLWKQFVHHQRDLKAELGYVNERMLFHGTSNSDDIKNNGFNEGYANMNGMFGAGLYFARHSSKANQYVFSSAKAGACNVHQQYDCKVCERKMLLCRVSMGKSKIETVVHKYPHPPAGYNSVIGVPGAQLKYPEYIVYRREQAYPEYLITYKLK